MGKISFDVIRTKLSPKGYIKDLLAHLKPDRYEKVVSGELVIFDLPADKEFSLTYVGEMPEKFDLVDDKLTVEMTRCVLIVKRAVWDPDFSCDVARVEVINAL